MKKVANLFVCNSVKHWQILVPFSLLDLQMNVMWRYVYTHLTWSMLLHYLVKLEMPKTLEMPKIHVNMNVVFNGDCLIVIKCIRFHFHEMFWWSILMNECRPLSCMWSETVMPLVICCLLYSHIKLASSISAGRQCHISLFCTPLAT